MSSEQISSEFLERIQKLSPKRLALLAAELERRLALREAAVAAPVAVVGIGCRMPGGANTPEMFWKLLAGKNDAIEEIPRSRWDADEFYDPRPGTPGKMNTKWGGFVEEIDQFDAAFFGISPREAVGLDPQQRMLLEVSWEALENACIRPDSLNGSPTAVFVGMSTNDYASLLSDYDDELFDAYSGTGIARSVAAGRLSYFLGLKGPNVAIDTACSSSAVAIHMACQSLRQNECRQALAGGVNAMLQPQLTVTLSQARMLASDGRCKTFSKLADGFVRSEGCGMLVLKRLADAEADGDTILGIIRGSAVNHDGRSSGLTAPNGPSQEAVVNAALLASGVRAQDVDYLETHGTGTVLGDAIELGALGSVFSKRSSDGLLNIGSVKTNIGHMEAAAGVAGVIKVLLALKHDTIPAHLHFSEEQKNDALIEAPLKVPVDATPWLAREGRPRIAGISSFGFSGTNAHLVIQEAPASRVRSTASSVEVLAVSARTAKALTEICARYSRHLQEHPETVLTDFAFSLNTGRAQFQHRIAILATSIKDASSQLQQIAVADVEKHVAYRFIAGYEEASIGFLFTGQGAQYPAMGRALYSQNSAFKAAVDRCDKILSAKLSHSLAAVLRGDDTVPEDLIHDTAWTQPALFAFEYALAMMWRSWGVRPSVVMGHSLGEYVAACIAGVFSLEDALTLAYERGRLMGNLPRGGRMLAARVGEAEITEILRPFSGLSIASINGAMSVVVSGDSEQVERVAAILAGKGVTSQPLTVSHAFHSSLMDPILDAFEGYAAKLATNEPEIALVSNVTGNVQRSASTINAGYWRRHLRGTVRFADGLTAMLGESPAALLEIGPDPVLLGMARPALVQPAIPGIASLQRTKDTWLTLYEALRQLYLAGASIQWSEVYRDRPAHKLALPTYPFQRQRYWVTIREKRPRAALAADFQDAAEVASDFDPLLYTMQWETQSTTHEDSSSLRPDDLLQAAADTIQSAVDSAESHKTLAAYERFLPELNRLCSLYVVETLISLGLDLRPAKKIVRQGLLSDLSVSPDHGRLMERMLSILEEDGIVSLNDDGWTVDRVPSVTAAEVHSGLVKDFPQFAAELNFVKQALHLPSVLRGQMSAVEALFPDGSLDLAEQVYQEAPVAQIFNRSVAEVVKKAVDSYSSDRQIKIVEVGAGTGSTTSRVLPLLADKNVDYLFTDVSPAFSTKARAKFAAFPFVRYGVLDVEKTENIEASIRSSADIIIAANVLHATADLAETINNIKLVLRPGGTLILLEGIKPQRFGDLTVGMTDGWWRYTDSSFRDNYPLIRRDSWLHLLSNAGFECVALSEDGAAKAITSQQTIVIARYTPLPQGNQNIEALFFESTDDRLAASLQSSGIDVRSVSEPYSNELLNSALLGSRPPRHIIFELPVSENGDVIGTSMRNATAALSLLQGLVKANVRTVDVWLMSRGASVECGRLQNIASKIADGLARAARLEYPEFAIRRIDLPLEPTDQDVRIFADILREGTREHDMEIHGGQLKAARVVPLSAVATRKLQKVVLSHDGAYLITGAFGGLGLRTAQWLAERGARTIYMVGRHEPSDAVMERITSLSSAGVTCHCVIEDVAKKDSVAALLQRLTDDGAILRGIIHAAGTVDDATLLQQTPLHFETVFAAKVAGSWHLHEATKHLPLEFFVMYGSAASVLGSAGQSNHSAANSFQEALANLRHSMGLPATTIAWGAWSEIGAATRVKDTGRSHRWGLNAMTPEKGIELLEQAIGSGRPNVAALPLDWKVYLAPGHSSASWPLFKMLVSDSPADGSSSHVEVVNLKEELESAAPEDRLTVIKTYVRARVTDVLRLDAGFALLDDQPLAELGLDSLMALELKNELQSAASITLPPNFFFEYPTLNLASVCLDARLVVPRRASDSSEYEELSI